MKKIQLLFSGLLCSLFLITNSMAQTPDSLFIVGSATPIGWSIDKAIKLVKDGNTFVYEGEMVPGEFKFPFNQNTDWAQDMLMRNADDSTKFYVHKGGDSDDSKWQIYTKGWYRIELNFSDSGITYQPLNLYIVGSATSIGWSIDKALQLEQDTESPYIFTYTDDMLKGEFKFPVNRNTDWGQNMYMKVAEDTTKIYLHKGGESDDSKWILAEEGNYTITVNVKDMSIGIVKNGANAITSVSKNQIQLISNLVSDKIEVTGVSNFNYRIYSVSGTLISTGTSNSYINAEKLNKGMYLLQISSKNNQAACVKFLKQ